MALEKETKDRYAIYCTIYCIFFFGPSVDDVAENIQISEFIYFLFSLILLSLLLELRKIACLF